MGSARISFDDAEWRKFITRNQGRGWYEILRGVMSTIGHKDIVQHFRDEKGEEGKWQERSRETQQRYAKIFSGQWKVPRGASMAEFNPSNKILHKTGKLSTSILPTNITKISKTAARMFSNVDYSGAHDNGTKNIPKRDFMWLSDGATDRMMTAIMNMAFE